MLHELLDSYKKGRGDTGEKFRPRKTLLLLVEQWRDANKSNARIDSALIAGQVGIEDILRAFSQAVQFIAPRSTARNSTTTRAASALQTGTEIRLRDPQSKLHGWADLIESNAIIDFKTGDEESSHIEQLLFYAALYQSATSRTPEQLRLVYTRTGKVLDVPLPSSGQLQALLILSRQRAVTAEGKINSNALEARPERSKCSQCNVRALCDEYWLARPNFKERESGTTSEFADFEKMPNAEVESATFGAYLRATINGERTTVYLPGEELARKIRSEDRARVLSLRSTRESDSIRLAVTQFTEVYIFS